MGLDSFPEVFDPSRCVLFLGAGFSAGARNKRGTTPPVGSELAREIRKLTGVSDDDAADLADLAGYAVSEGVELFSLLEGLFTIKETSEDQDKILSLPWWRIYTTNFDNSVSAYLAKSGKNSSEIVYDLTDNPPRQLRKGRVIHLHGSIAKCNREKLDDSLILSRRSYVEQQVKGSPWWDWFDRDIRTAQYVFFLGYDLNDFEPAKYLIKYPDIRGRRHFILRTPRSPIAESKLKDYGVRHSFEIRGFVESLARAQVATVPAHENELSSFRYIDLEKDNRLPKRPGSAEIQELLAFGRLRFDAMKATLPRSEYVVFREFALNRCEYLLRNNKILIIHGKIGNGKSILADELKINLSRTSFQCFELRENITPLPEDIEFLRSLSAPVVFFPSYDSAVANFHLFSEMPGHAKYVVEMPTRILQVRMDEVRSKLPGMSARFDVDKLNENEVSELRSLLRLAGLSSLSASPELRKGIEFREFILISYEDPEIAQRLKSIIGPLLDDSALKKVILASAVLKAAGLQVDAGFVEDATNEDPYDVLNRVGGLVYELMEYSIDKIEPHSSILSEHIIKRYVSSSDVVDVIFNLAAESSRRIEEERNFSTERFRRARSILSSIIRFGFVETIVGSDFEGRKFIKQLYELCRSHILIQKEPLFWLQYSILWQDESRWDLAESHILEAYLRGAERGGFKTFQLDTNYLGLLCDLELNAEAGTSVSRFDKLLELIDVCRSMIDDGSHRGHVIKAFLKVEPMIAKRAPDLTKSQAVSLTHALNLVIQRLEHFSPDERALWGTDDCRRSLERSVGTLVKLYAVL